MKIIDWLVKNTITVEPKSLESVAKMHIAQKKLNDAVHADNKRKAELAERQRKVENYRLVEQHLRKSVGNKYIQNSHNYNYTTKLKDDNPDEWGFLTIHDYEDKQIGSFYCKRPDKFGSVKHTFDIPRNTTVTHALFTTKAGYQYPEMSFPSQSFVGQGTFTITMTFN